MIASGRLLYRQGLTPGEIRFLSGATATIIAYLAVFEISVGGFQVGLNSSLQPSSVRSQPVRYLLATMAYIWIITSVNIRLASLTELSGQDVISIHAGRLYRARKAHQIFRTTFLFYVLKPSALLIFGVSPTSIVCVLM